MLNLLYKVLVLEAWLIRRLHTNIPLRAEPRDLGRGHYGSMTPAHEPFKDWFWPAGRLLVKMLFCFACEF